MISAIQKQPPPLSRLERAVAWVSPKWAMQRAMWRTFEASYKGGLATRTSESWVTTDTHRFGTSADRAFVLSARDRAYNAYDNNPVAQTLIDVETDNVIGDGLNYQPTTSSKAWNREAIDRYYDWLENCSVRGSDVETGREIQRLMWTQSRVAGDAGWVLVSRGADSFVQSVRAEHIVTPDGQNADQNIIDGIRFDAQGKPLTFYILTTDSLGARRTFEGIPARDFVWLPHMTKSGQARPPSCYVTIFDLLAHLDRYIDGVSLAAWMATVFGIIFKKTNPAQQYGNLPFVTNSQGNQQRAVTFENGSVKYVGTDEEVAQVQAQQPMAQTESFIRGLLRQIGMPFRMPLEVVALDMSTANFASARIGLLPFYRSCRFKAAWFASHWSRTIRWWLSRERLRAPDDPKRWVTEFPEDYWSHELLVNAWTYTDPVSEAQGDLLELDMRTKSPQMVIQERGRDAEQILRDWKEWQAATEDELPMPRSTMTRDPISAAAPGGSSNGNGQAPPADDEDGEEPEEEE